MPPYDCCVVICNAKTLMTIDNTDLIKYIVQGAGVLPQAWVKMPPPSAECLLTTEDRLSCRRSLA